MNLILVNFSILIQIVKISSILISFHLVNLFICLFNLYCFKTLIYLFSHLIYFFDLNSNL